MVKFIGWSAIIIFGIAIIGVILESDEEPSSPELSSPETEPIVVDAPKTETKIERTENQYVSSSRNGIVACPTSIGLERFIDVAIDKSKDDGDRTQVVDNNDCRIVGERDVITLLIEKQPEGGGPLAGQYSYETGTSAFAIILVDIERGENRTPSARDIVNGRYWVVTSIVFDNSWEKGKELPFEPPDVVETKEESPQKEPEVIRVTQKVDSLHPLLACYQPGMFHVMAESFEKLPKDQHDEIVYDMVKGGACKEVRAGESIIVTIVVDSESPNTTVNGPNGEILLVRVTLVEPDPGFPATAYVMSTQAIMNTKITKTECKYKGRSFLEDCDA